MNRSILFCLIGIICGILISACEVFILIIPLFAVFTGLSAIFKRPAFLIGSLFLIIGAISASITFNFDLKPVNEFAGKDDLRGTFYIKDVLEKDNNFSMCHITLTEVNGKKLKEDITLYFYGENNPKVNNIYSFEKMKLGACSKESIVKFGRTDTFYSGNLSVSNTEITGKVKTTPLSIIREFRQKANKEIDRTFSKRTRGFLKALFTGDKSGLDVITKKHFKDSGISHILAISGMHVVILMSILEILTFKKQNLKWILIVFLFVFIFFSGASSSVVRASGIYFAMFLSEIFKRSRDSLNVLFVMAFISLLFEPLILFSKSFQLSYLACFAIIAVTPVFYTENKIKPFNYISEMTASTLAVQVMTFPVIYTMSSKITFFVICANLFAISLLPAIYIAGYIALITKLPLAVTAVEYMTKFLMFTAELFSKNISAGNSTVLWGITVIIALFVFFLCLDRNSRVIRKEIAKS